MTTTDIGYDARIGIPVPAEIFANHPDSAFWIGKVAMGNTVIKPVYYDGLSRLRAKVYVDEMHFLTAENLDTFGRESDQDDARSAHFAVIENASSQNSGSARVVGSARLILKGTNNKSLPIESYFPEVFEGNPLEDGSIEVSRFIARHENRQTQHTIALALIRAMTHYSIDANLKSAYCIIETPLLNLLTSIGVPIEMLGGSKEIDEYGGVLFPVKINPYEIIDSIRQDMTGKIALKRFFQEEIPNQGIGFYPNLLTGGVND